VPLQRNVIVGEVAVVRGDVRRIEDERWREEGAEPWKQKWEVRESGKRDLQQMPHQPLPSSLQRSDPSNATMLDVVVG
jgi:hypothetical protein